ncbi:putative Alpha beta hydrolase family [Trypanosoma vivax]|uniref:Serine aminopeptidase S33 domain-containing protein n=1 Tax=Trypanosoma vivax (strain Y486) TaxID=1055687 RepID=G0TVP0_TRYVY|nr:hypothetical protein TRVL_03642 [Trypanosoma vivax]KAH8620690.1 putative Alpha beta hydrolase family [Trypanosoma vivax]CCC48006.1 conserved hypothetical protein [Trypanosoma vivax Y486]
MRVKKGTVIFSIIHVLIYILNVLIISPLQVLARVVARATSRQTDQTINVFGSPLAMSHFPFLKSYCARSYDAPAFNGHLSTILCGFRPRWPVPYTREFVDGPDGNPICLDWFLASTVTREAKGIMIVFPGLASWSQTNYVQHYVWRAHRRGIHCCVINGRGLGDTPLKQPRLISATWTGDVHRAMSTALARRSLELKFGHAAENVWGVGFSLGGVILSKFLAEEAENGRALPPFDAAIVLNSPLDAGETSKKLLKVKSRLYQRNMVRNVMRYFTRHETILRELPGPSHEAYHSDPLSFLKHLKNLEEFDHHINAPHNGFCSIAEYHAAASVLTTLRCSRVPTLCVIAKDDPVVCDVSSERLKELANENNLVAFIKFPYGGHLGYFGNPIEVWNEVPSLMEDFVCNAILSGQGHWHRKDSKHLVQTDE